MPKKSPGIRCTDCGLTFDRSEYYTHICDCERVKAEKAAQAKEASRKRLIAQNLAMVEHAFAEYDAS